MYPGEMCPEAHEAHEAHEAYEAAETAAGVGGAGSSGPPLPGPAAGICATNCDCIWAEIADQDIAAGLPPQRKE